MNFLGIGPLELTLILLIALLVIGPNDLAKTGLTLGRWMRKIVLSQEWKTIQNASRELRTLPNKLIREAGIEEARQVIKEHTSGISQELNTEVNHVQSDLSSWLTPDQTIKPPSSDHEPRAPSIADNSQGDITPDKE